MKTTLSLAKALGATASIATLMFCSTAATAQQGATQGELPRQSGGGAGININLGNIFSTLKNAAQRGNPNQPPVLQKRADSIGIPSGGNYTVNWVISYANTSTQTLVNAVVRDGPIATIIPGSLQQPAGWSPGVTNATPPPKDNWAQWTGASVPPHGVMTATFPTANGGSAIGGAGHDGYIPIPYNSPRFGPRVYIFNHGPTTGANFQCGDASGACPGWPKSAPVGDSSGETFQSFSGLNEESGIINGRLYYPVNKATNFTFGIACFDLESEAECGYTPVGRTQNLSTNNFPNAKDVSGTSLNLATTASLGRDAILKGPWIVNNELYFADFIGNVYCAKPGLTLSPCVGTYYLPTNQIQLATPTYDPKYGRSPAISYAANQFVSGRVVNGKLYLATSTRLKHDSGGIAIFTPIDDGKAYINCLNASTKNACWSNPPPSGSPSSKGTGAHSYTLGRNGGANDVTMALANNFIYYDTSGTAKALCQYLKVGSGSFGTSSAINSKQCFDLNTGGAFTPSSTAAIFTNPPQYHGYGTEVHIWPRTFFPDYATTDVHCWNWQTNSSCDSSSKNYFAKTSLFGDPKNYALNVDDNQCVWAYGDAGFLWNFDPNNLDKDGVAKPCGSSGKFTKIFQPLTYCSGPKPFHWTSVEVKSALLANFDKFIIKVLDSTNNTVLMTKDLKATNATAVDTSSQDAQTLNKPLKIEVEYTPKAGTTDKPYLEVHYNAPAPEFCFQSTHTCQQGKITNMVEAQDPFDPTKSVKAQAEVARPQSCGVPPPVCGTPGQPPCPCQTCGTASTAPCAACGQAGQPPCPKCGQPGQPTCPVGDCIPGTPGCNPPPPPPPPNCVPGSFNCPVLIIGCIPGTPGCLPRPPITRDPVCLTGDCSVKPQQSVAEEYKEPKVSCVRKPKPVAEEPKKVAPKPRPKPIVIAAPVAVDPNAPPKPKPKPRPKPAQPKAAAHEEDDCD